MMNNNKKLYVIKFSDGQYYCGMKQFSNQLRQAQIYVSLSRAEDTALHLISTKDRYTKDIIAPTLEFKLVEVMIEEVPES